MDYIKMKNYKYFGKGKYQSKRIKIKATQQGSETIRRGR